MTQKYGTSFVRRGEGAEVSNLPEYFLHSLPKMQEALPEYYLLFARKLLFEQFGGGGAAAPISTRLLYAYQSLTTFHYMKIIENVMFCF